MQAASVSTGLLRGAASLAPASRPSRKRLVVTSIFKLGTKKEPAVDRKGRPIKPAPTPKSKDAPKGKPAPPPAKRATPAAPVKAKPTPPPRTAGKPAAAAAEDGSNGSGFLGLFGGTGTQKGGTGNTSNKAASKAKPALPPRTAGKPSAAAANNNGSGGGFLGLFANAKPAASTGGTGTTRRAAVASSRAAGTRKVAPPPRTAGKPSTGSQRVMSAGALAAAEGTRRMAASQRTATPTAPAASRRTTSSSSSSSSSRTSSRASEGPSDSDQDYFNVTGYPFPLGPFLKRPTIRKEIVRGVMWGFEQPQSLGGSNVTTNIRMTIVRLLSGGLWVHAPIAPTRECVRMVQALEEKTGEKVQYIVLPTFAYEHKVFVGPFSRRFPKAQVWVAPSQWSLPINLPSQFFGIFPTGELRTGDAAVPWADELDQKVYESSVGIAPYIEVAFFHKASRTLLVTDAVISVPQEPPELVPQESLLEAAARNFFINVLSGPLATEPVDGVPLVPTELTPAARSLGWRRMAMQILYIVPGDLRDPRKGFQAIAERLIVGPILKTLVFSTTPDATREWVDDIVGSWDFTSVVPAHFSAPVRATPAEFKAAFSFVYEPQLSQERAAAAAIEAARRGSSSSDKAAALAAARAAAAAEQQKESVNPAKALDGALVGLLGGLNIRGSTRSSSAGKAAAKGSDEKEAGSDRAGFSYPAEDIAALNTARRFLVSAGVVKK